MTPQQFARKLQVKFIATSQTVIDRRAVCDACPEKKKEYFTNIEICDKCGCVIKAKTMASANTCPLDKWVK